MIKAVVLKKVALTAEKGSVVIISEGQFKALGDKVTTYKGEAKGDVEEKEEPEKAKKPAPKKTSTKAKKKG